ncbi:transcription factor LAX PANICLE 1 [Brachypodium distachyon]|uniref:BHLH domain-containing protein n=1 Tax=Brachypodium distachyon TaxID=15368 RepID=I1HT21_BRADI|nr:transcription factor LAX PANICLE 1 [Brachypodium distachyon]KQK10418.1 hypothetical protein BRADI_2g54030v3 [Brachypodium distachyon]|eukprot:XP_003567247.1 transcription factor LAX PANICLE 1 [Brachypodium distachyon]
MDPYHHYGNTHDPRGGAGGFPIHPQPQPPYFLHHHHPAAALAEGRPMRVAGGGRRRPGTKLSTDPQSVAARERRHRISDRFRVLRSLVPGGSKMDTVSMLEQAIHYVKFLKAQVTLHQAALVQHEQEQEEGGRHGADDDEAFTAMQLLGVHSHAHAQEMMGCYHAAQGAHHQLVEELDLGPGGQMSSSAHDLPPLPSCIFDEESSAAACYSVCTLQGEEITHDHGSSY